MSLGDEIMAAVQDKPGMTDREITNKIRGTNFTQQPINQRAKILAAQGRLIRKQRAADGLIGNYIGNSVAVNTASQKIAQSVRQKNHDKEALSEEEIKALLNDRLKEAGWSTSVAWGKKHGIDIDARKGAERLIVEVKGPGSKNPMRVNYFLSIIGEILQRMDDADARYFIALPDLPQYRGLWERLPTLAKEKTGISLLLVSSKGDIEWLNQTGADPFTC